MMSTSAWPTPTVSRNTSSLPAASISSAACSAASARPPSAPRLAIERMNTPGSRKCSVRRMRSPSSAPCVNGEDGSIESTADVAVAARAGAAISAPISVDLPAPGGPVKPTTAALPGVRIDLADERPALGVVVLDERDRPRERALVAREQALGEGSVGRHGRGRIRIRSDGARVSPDPAAPRRRARRARRRCTAARSRCCASCARHGMLNHRYARLLAALALAEAALARAPADRRAVLRRPRREARDRPRRDASRSAAGRGSATARRSACTRARSRSGPRPCSARSARSRPSSTSRSGASASSPTA